MNPQHRRAFDAALREWAHARTLYAFDFDGTLAPLVDDPDDARMPAAVWETLRALQSHALVAVISGRSRASLLPLLPELTYLVGNHGNEGLPVIAGQAGARIADTEPICTGWIEQLQVGQAHLHRAGVLQGVVAEHKGYTLSIHYRHCADHVRAHAELVARVAQLTPAPRVIEGVLVLNLLPPGTRTKREALQILQQDSGCERALFIGDDLTDELVFQGAPPNWLCVRVGPSETTAARFVVDGTAGVAELLEQLVSVLSLRARLASAAHGDSGHCKGSILSSPDTGF